MKLPEKRLSRVLAAAGAVLGALFAWAIQRVFLKSIFVGMPALTPDTTHAGALQAVVVAVGAGAGAVIGAVLGVVVRAWNVEPGEPPRR